MADDKKKQAMSLLFGDAPSKPQRPLKPQRLSRRTVEEEPETPTALGATAMEVPKRAAPETRDPPLQPERSQRPLQAETPDPYYTGQSRYRRRSGTEVKHSIYLDEDVSQALKLAAALGKDPRGTSMSAIVNSALRELGYRR
mgnify:FL=1